MTEPKYKLYDVVTIPLENGERRNAVIYDISEMEYPDGWIYYAMPKRESDNEHMFYENNLQPVKIYPDYGEVFCKDCKHYFDEGKLGYAGWSKECPLWSWSWEYYNDLPTLQDENGTDLQPPPNCHCFDPKDNNADKNI